MTQTGQQKLQQKKRRREVKWYHVAFTGIIMLACFSLWLLKNSIIQLIKRSGIVYLFSVPWIQWTLFILGIFGAAYVCIFFLLARKQQAAWKVLLRRRSTYKNLSRATFWLGTLITAVILILSNAGVMPGSWSNALIALIAEFSLVVAFLTLQYTIHPLPARTQLPVEPPSSQPDLQQPAKEDTAQGIKDSHTAKPGLFISYCDCQPDKRWAKWCQSVLEADYSITIRPWNFQTDATFLKEMEDTIRETVCTIMVLSHAYLKALATWPWANAFKYEDQTGRSPGLLLTLVEPCVQDKEDTGVLKSITSLDLFVLDPTTARKKLLEEVQLVVSKAQSSMS